jgi:hypothetical protein
MKGEAARLSAARRDDKHIPTQGAVRRVVSGKGYLASVGREDGQSFQQGSVGEAARLSAFALDDPDVACVREGYVRAAQRERLQRHGAFQLSRAYFKKEYEPDQ